MIFEGVRIKIFFDEQMVDFNKKISQFSQVGDFPEIGDISMRLMGNSVIETCRTPNFECLISDL